MMWIIMEKRTEREQYGFWRRLGIGLLVVGLLLVVFFLGVYYAINRNCI